MLSVIKLIYQILYFLLELCMLATLGYWGFQSTKNSLLNYTLGIGLPLLAAVLWGIWAAPKSPRRLDFPYRLLFSSALFSVAIYLHFRVDRCELGIAFGIASLASQLLAFRFEKR